MDTKILGFLAPALLAGPMAANAQAVVYDFTGVVTSSEIDTFAGPAEPFPSVPIGTQVSGTYTLDFANAIGNVDTAAANWIAGGGSSLFSSTIRAGQVVYATSPIFAQSIVEGLHPDGDPTPTFVANEGFQNYSTGGGSQFSIVNPHGAWSAGGLPIFAGAELAAGEVDFSPVDSGVARFYFILTSLVRAPELDAASAAGGLTLLLSALAMAMGTHRAR